MIKAEFCVYKSGGTVEKLVDHTLMQYSFIRLQGYLYRMYAYGVSHCSNCSPVCT